MTQTKYIFQLIVEVKTAAAITIINKVITKASTKI